jgi:hypothetical protein
VVVVVVLDLGGLPILASMVQQVQPVKHLLLIVTLLALVGQMVLVVELGNKEVTLVVAIAVLVVLDGFPMVALVVYMVIIMEVLEHLASLEEWRITINPMEALVVELQPVMMAEITIATVMLVAAATLVVAEWAIQTMVAVAVPIIRVPTRAIVLVSERVMDISPLISSKLGFRI